MIEEARSAEEAFILGTLKRGYKLLWDESAQRYLSTHNHINAQPNAVSGLIERGIIQRDGNSLKLIQPAPAVHLPEVPEPKKPMRLRRPASITVTDQNVIIFREKPHSMRRVNLAEVTRASVERLNRLMKQGRIRFDVNAGQAYTHFLIDRNWSPAYELYWQRATAAGEPLPLMFEDFESLVRAYRGTPANQSRRLGFYRSKLYIQD